MLLDSPPPSLRQSSSQITTQLTASHHTSNDTSRVQVTSQPSELSASTRVQAARLVDSLVTGYSSAGKSESAESLTEASLFSALSNVLDGSTEQAQTEQPINESLAARRLSEPQASGNSCGGGHEGAARWPMGDRDGEGGRGCGEGEGEGEGERWWSCKRSFLSSDATRLSHSAVGLQTSVAEAVGNAVGALTETLLEGTVDGESFLLSAPQLALLAKR